MNEEEKVEITRHGQWPILKYNVRRPRHSNASIFIDDETGMIVVDTDFGQQDTYSHWWGPQGRGSGTLREFLTTVSGTGYLEDKFSYGKERWDLDKAENDIRAALAEKDLSEMDRDEVEDFFGSYTHTIGQNEFGLLALENEVISERLGFEFFCESSPGSVYSNPDTKKMVEKVLLPLIEYWKTELKENPR